LKKTVWDSEKTDDTHRKQLDLRGGLRDEVLVGGTPQKFSLKMGASCGN